MRDERTIVVLEGDERGQELLEESLRVLEPGVIGVELDFPRFDLSLERRRQTENGIVHEAAAAVREHGLGLKAATVAADASATKKRIRRCTEPPGTSGKRVWTAAKRTPRPKWQIARKD